MKKKTEVANVESTPTNDIMIELVKYFGTYIINQLLTKGFWFDGQWDNHHMSFTLKSAIPNVQTSSKTRSRKK